ncbi:MAG: tRNA glutamyl-Q(34) synthetase GluQRS [Planctomycetota bacterium]
MNSRGDQVVGRLAPSPTGAQHLGNARTHLAAFWSVRSAGGVLRLRIEDIDSPRVKPWASQQAIDDLSWLGIEWDDEVIIQTDRRERYDEVLRSIIECGHAYPCVCTRRDIEAAASAPHADADGTVYPGTCAGWQVGNTLPKDGSFCWRFRMGDGAMVFTDDVYGVQSCRDVAAAIGDFPITRKTGDAAYQLAVVIDDHDTGVNEVVRGADLRWSTFRQHRLMEALRWPPPRLRHVPLVVGRDGRRLAKRHGDTRLSWYRQQGVAPQRVITWAAQSLQQLPTAMNADAALALPLRQLHEAIVSSFNVARIPTDETIVYTDPATWLH